jgi:chromosome partitioning protein
MIIAAFNPKGGVGKTTTAVNMASALARSGRPVLLLDLESDMHASISVGIRPAEVVPSIADVLLHQARASDAVRTVPGSPNLHLITGSPRLTGLDLALRNVRQPDRRLADAVRPLAGDFDAVIMDSPAGFSLMALSVLSAAEELIVPIRTDYLSLESLAHFLRWYRERRAGRKGLADVTGILLTMVDYRR